MEQLVCQKRIMEYASNDHIPPFERLRFISIVQDNLRMFFEKYWAEVVNTELKDPVSDLLNSILELIEGATEQIIEYINKEDFGVSICESPGDEITDKLLARIIEGDAVSYDQLESSVIYLSANEGYYKIMPEHFFFYSKTDATFYPLYSVVDSNDQLGFTLLYRQRDRKYVSDNYPHCIIEVLSSYRKNGKPLVDMSTQAHQLISSDVVFYEAPAALFMNWALIYEAVPEKQALYYAPWENLTKKHQQQVTDFSAERDRILHFPMDDFSELVSLLRECIHSGKVSELSVTIYRVIVSSEFYSLLLLALEKTIKVNVIIEVKSSYEELKNLAIVDDLRNMGANVVLSPHNLKHHAKWILVNFKDNTYQDIAFVSTGNWNEKNALCYIDYVYITRNKAVVKDLSNFLRYCKGETDTCSLKKLWISQVNFGDKLFAKIEQLKQHAKAGGKASIFIKVNELSYHKVIDALQDAVACGVTLTIVARTCSLLTESPGIKVKSYLGRFLEHSRIFGFERDGHEPEVYLSSADLRKRNFEKRFEIAVEVEDKESKQVLLNMIKLYSSNKYRHVSYDAKGRYSWHEKEDLHEWMIRES